MPAQRMTFDGATVILVPAGGVEDALGLGLAALGFEA
jgi:hypothetical protein